MSYRYAFLIHFTRFCFQKSARRNSIPKELVVCHLIIYNKSNYSVQAEKVKVYEGVNAEYESRFSMAGCAKDVRLIYQTI